MSRRLAKGKTDMMPRNAGCKVTDHHLSRRTLLQGTASVVAAGGWCGNAAAANVLASQQKRVLQIFLQGGLSQLESWDPKPGTRYGGPFRAIDTSVPGVRICELLPYTAQRMHHLSIVRSLDIKTNSHQQGRLFMEMGRPAGVFPYLGSVVSKYCAPPQSTLPGFIHITTRGLTDNTSAFLEAKHAQLRLLGPQAPENVDRPQGVTAEIAARRDAFRQRLNSRFSGRVGQQAYLDSYDSSFAMAEKLMAQKSLFEAEPSSKDVERYGRHDFAGKCLLARRLLKNGATCVKVTHHGYDTHAENFNFHIEQLGEFDRTFCMLLDDLHDAGMLESTLVMIYSEFGRTPKINQRYGRDHWGTAWSVALGGCGLKSGMVVGQTNADGTAVADREVDGGHLFHTYLQALGLETSQDHDLVGRSVPIGDPSSSPIEELLA